MGITNQGESILLWDGKTGQQLHNIQVWQDTSIEPKTDYFCENVDLD